MPRFTALLGVVVVCLGLLQFGLVRADFWSREDPISRWLDLGQEQSLPAWYTSIAIFVCGLVVVECGRRDTALRPWWIVAAAGLWFLSADEIVGVHEKLSHLVLGKVDLHGLFNFEWVVVAIPIVMVLAVVTIPFIRLLPRETATDMIIAASVFIIGALGAEMIGALLVDLGRIAEADIEILFEEGLEILGVNLLLRALSRHLDRWRIA